MSSEAESGNLTLDEKLFTVRRKPITHSHIRLDEDLCKNCPKRTCTYICPADVYTWDESAQKMEINYENCLECGSCRVACAMDNIEWSNPVWGEGISYKVS